MQLSGQLGVKRGYIRSSSWAVAPRTGAIYALVQIFEDEPEKAESPCFARRLPWVCLVASLGISPALNGFWCSVADSRRTRRFCRGSVTKLPNTSRSWQGRSTQFGDQRRIKSGACNTFQCTASNKKSPVSIRYQVSAIVERPDLVAGTPVRIADPDVAGGDSIHRHSANPAGYSAIWGAMPCEDSKRTITGVTARTKFTLDVAALFLVQTRAHLRSRSFRISSNSARCCLLTLGYASFILARR